MSENIFIVQEVDLEASTVSLRSDGILQIFMKPERTMSLIDGVHMVETFYKIGVGKKFRLLFIAGNFTLADNDARNYAASPEANKYTIASAFIVNNIAQKLMANAYISFNRPLTPTKAFNTVEEGVVWLKTFRK